MTRPQKESNMKREHRVTIRLTDTEFSIIKYGRTGRHDYFRVYAKTNYGGTGQY